ncbi:MAG: amino acid ABC transporter substrate-binding protein [Propionivibrio sp.]
MKPEFSRGKSERSCFRRIARTGRIGLMALLSLNALAAGTLEKIAQTGTIRLGYQVTPPFSYLDDPKAPPIGYSIDLCMKVVEAVKQHLKRDDIKVEFAEVTPVSRVPMLTKREIDIECANTPNTADIRKDAAFTIPTFMAVTRLMVRDGSNIKTLPDLDKKTVVTIWGSNIEKIFDETNDRLSLGASNVIVNDFDGAFSIMATNKADAFMLDDVLIRIMQATSSNKTKYKVVGEALAVQPLALMFRKDDADFKRLVDAEIARIIIKGEIYPIYKKWFESPIPPNKLSPMYKQWADIQTPGGQINLRLPMVYELRDSFKVPSDWVPDFTKR